MTDAPGVWSDNLMRNFERLTEWCDAVVAMCAITDEHYALYTRRRVFDIDDEELQTALQAHGCNLGFLLEWIARGSRSINANPRLPSGSRIELPFDAQEHQSAWDAHVSAERRQLPALEEQARAFAAHVREKVRLFYEEMSDGYSSYSDYSEETTTSDEDVEDVKSRRPS